jgi:hypothetical protein
MIGDELYGRWSVGAADPVTSTGGGGGSTTARLADDLGSSVGE